MERPLAPARFFARRLARFLAAVLILACLVLACLAWALPASASPQPAASPLPAAEDVPAGAEAAILAGGCFWCLESEFRGKPGVLKTVAGYTGGTLENPSYKAVTTGTTGHAEALLIYYDPAATSYEKLLEHFFLHAHDPTTLNSQWVDQGTQYRSAIFYLNEDQKAQAEAYIDRLTEQHLFKNPIVTAVEKAGRFWPAESYHQNYYEKYKAQTGQEHIRVKLKKKVIEAREREIEKNRKRQSGP